MRKKYDELYENLISFQGRSPNLTKLRIFVDLIIVKNTLFYFIFKFKTMKVANLSGWQYFLHLNFKEFMFYSETWLVTTLKILFFFNRSFTFLNQRKIQIYIFCLFLTLRNFKTIFLKKLFNNFFFQNKKKTVIKNHFLLNFFISVIL